MRNLNTNIDNLDLKITENYAKIKFEVETIEKKMIKLMKDDKIE
jgi:hypothetical protein